MGKPLQIAVDGVPATTEATRSHAICPTETTISDRKSASSTGDIVHIIGLRCVPAPAE
jgi:hypothetical protein